MHVKLEKATHANFKTKLIEHGLSMQEAFERFAKLVGDGQPTANKLLESLIKERVKKELASMGMTPTKRKLHHVNELNDERLYDLINEDPFAGDDSSNDSGDANEIP